MATKQLVFERLTSDRYYEFYVPPIPTCGVSHYTRWKHAYAKYLREIYTIFSQIISQRYDFKDIDPETFYRFVYHTSSRQIDMYLDKDEIESKEVLD